jgi:hypothetical protein
LPSRPAISGLRKQIDRLQEAVTGPAAGWYEPIKMSDIIDTLSRLPLPERAVTCSRVKPFLPGLLLPEVQVRIPTPITVHLDHCPECTEDLEALRDLGLSPEQLERLERLYHGPAAQDRRLCRKARSRIAAFVCGSLAGIEAELLDHLACTRCRSRVYRSRQKLLEKEANGESQALGADDDIAAAEIFDYAVPYGRTDGGAQPVGDTPMQTGRACLKKIQELDETIYGIAERTDSGIATVYKTVETDAQPQRATASVAEGTDAPGIAQSYCDPYPGYPIHVQVIEPAPASGDARLVPRGSQSSLATYDLQPARSVDPQGRRGRRGRDSLGLALPNHQHRIWNHPWTNVQGLRESTEYPRLNVRSAHRSIDAGILDLPRDESLPHGETRGARFV